MSLRCQNAAQRRYNLRIGIAMALYISLLALVQRYAGGVAAPALRYLLAALPALPVIACFGIMGRYLAEETDEYIRLRTTQQCLWATGLTLGAATLWGFLEGAGVPHLPMQYVAIGWFLALGLAAVGQKVAGQ